MMYVCFMYLVLEDIHMLSGNLRWSSACSVDFFDTPKLGHVVEDDLLDCHRKNDWKLVIG